ncbi:WxL domain-containing protein [Companilactobacillus alimentarius]|uniref:WxL domain-containing protein n=1 Tax=Companilactobacillus alimentarius TaxID=1602 RepID=UPI0028BBF06F|nr:WxL domain-containing protein [Companilactobacillus alimentarius]MDT6951923.1 WxL domain-containing protein [Companilactobacillus alimentarius]
MKKMLRNSLMLGAAILGISSVGGIAQAATTPTTTPTTSTTTTTPSTTSTATADITPGQITINSGPSFLFGTVKGSANDTMYTSMSTTGNVSVSDAASGTGYTVSVTASPFTTSGANPTTLKNAQLLLDDNETDPVKSVDSDNVSTPPTMIANAILSSDPVDILSAPAGTGVGAYTASYGNGDAELKVPAGNIGGSYSSTLNWTLSNAPS